MTHPEGKRQPQTSGPVVGGMSEDSLALLTTLHCWDLDLLGMAHGFPLYQVLLIMSAGEENYELLCSFCCPHQDKQLRGQGWIVVDGGQSLLCQTQL